MSHSPALSCRDDKTAKGRVYQEIKERIINGVYGGGRQLRQEELAEEFGVSRIPVREVLIQLDGEGLVEMHPYRGAVVSPLSSEEAKELFEIRYILESAALRFSSERMTERDYLDMEVLLDDAEAESDAFSRTEKNRTFHSKLYGYCGRPRLLEMIDGLHSGVDRYLRVYLRLMDYQQDSTEAHREMLKACREGRLDEACRLLKKHLDEASDRIRRFLAFS